MNMLGMPMQSTRGEPSNFSAAYMLFERGAYTKSYRLFLQLATAPHSPAAKYNLALLCTLVNEWQQALLHLEAVFATLKPPLPAQPPKGELERKLHALQGEGNGYRLPMREDFPQECGQEFREHTLRLMIDCCAALHLYERTRALASMLVTKNYHNVEVALQQCATE